MLSTIMKIKWGLLRGPRIRKSCV